MPRTGPRGKYGKAQGMTCLKCDKDAYAKGLCHCHYKLKLRKEGKNT